MPRGGKQGAGGRNSDCGPSEQTNCLGGIEQRRLWKPGSDLAPAAQDSANGADAQQSAANQRQRHRLGNSWTCLGSHRNVSEKQVVRIISSGAQQNRRVGGSGYGVCV